jgi:peroxiredoxin
MWKLFAVVLLATLIMQGCVTTDKARDYKPPAIGDKAPDFWMKNHEQLRVSLSDFSGKKNVILVFFPLAFTPV